MATEGWLERLVSEQGYKRVSWDALGTDLLGAKAWKPKGRAPSDARSLGAKLTKINKGAGLQSLLKTPNRFYLASLAEVLECDVAEVEAGCKAAVVGLAGEAGPEVQLRDLLGVYWNPVGDEPPWLPPVVRLFPEWSSRVWWCAPSGSGRTLAGAWLEANGVARLVSVEDFEEILPALDRDEALFIEAETQEEALAAFHEVQRWPVRICIAAPIPLPRSARQSGTEWREAQGPDLSGQIEEIDAWVVELVQGVARTGIKPGRFADLLRAWGPDFDVSCMFALAGLLHESGLGDGLVPSAPLTVLQKVEWRAGLAESYLKARLRRVEARFGDLVGLVEPRLVQWIRAMLRAIVFEVAEMGSSGLRVQDWEARVPKDQACPVDREGMIALVRQSKSKKAIEDQLEALVPATQIVQRLQTLGVLVGKHGEVLLEPEWVVDAITSDELRRMLDKPEAWSRVACHPDSAEALGEFLCEQIRAEAEPKSLRDASRVFGGGKTLEACASIGLLYRAVGIAILKGARPPIGWVKGLCKAEWRWVFWRQDSFPMPAFDHSEGEGRRWCGHGGWLLATYAITEYLGDHAPADSPALLSPWKEEKMPEHLPQLLSQITSVPKDWKNWTFALMGRLVERLGPACTQGGWPVEWQVPSWIIGTILAGEPLTKAHLTYLCVYRGSSAPNSADATIFEWLHQEVERRGLPWSRVASELFRAMFEEREVLCRHLLVTEPYCSWLWPHLPVEVLRERLAQDGSFNWPYELFDSHHWQVVVEFALQPAREAPRGWRHKQPFRQPALWAAIHEDAVMTLVSEKAFDWTCREIVTVLWARFPESMTDVVMAIVEEDEEGASVGFNLLASSLPRECARGVVGRLAIWVRTHQDLAPSVIHTLRWYLHHLVSLRVDGWRDAFDLWSSTRSARDQPG